MRHARLTAVLTAVTLFMSGCGSTATSESGPGEKKPGGTIVDLQNFAAGEPSHIDPALADDVQSSQIARLLYDGLTKTDKEGDVENAVADEVTPSADGKTWTFKLRHDVAFDNGDPVLPSDFKFAWQRVLNPELGSTMTGRFSVIEGAAEMENKNATELSGVTADDASRTLTVKLTAPYQDFPALVSTTVFSPLPHKLFETNPALNKTFEQGVMVGNGPFKMAGPWEHNKSIKLLSSSTYYGGPKRHKAYVQAVEFRVSKDLDAAFNDFDSGGAKVGRVPPGKFEEVEGEYSGQIVASPLLATEYWGFNLNDPTVGGAENAKLRQAIALAINKKDIINKLYGGMREVALQWTPPGLPGSRPPLESGDRNTAAAKDLLREWGKTPPSLKISFNAGAGHEEKASIIRQNLAEIGIQATVDPLDQASYGRAVRSGTLQFFRGSWTADYVSYDNFLAPLFASPPLGDQNVFGYRNSAFDQLITTARSDANAESRASKYRDAEKMLLTDQVIVPIDWPTAGIVRQGTVDDLIVDPLGYVDYAEASVL